MLLLLGSGLLDLSTSVRGMLATVASVAVIAGLHGAPGSWLSWLLGMPVLAYLGKISYGTYLWHWPVILVLDQIFKVEPWVLALLAAPISTGLAALSFAAFEMPIRRSAKLSRYYRQTIVAGLTLSVLAAMYVAPNVLRNDRRPAVVTIAGGQTLPTSLMKRFNQPVPADIRAQISSGEVLADRGPDDKWCSPQKYLDCQVVPGDGPSIVLVGDSQARMLEPAFEALAKEKGFQLWTSIVSSCPWQDGLYNTGASDSNQRQCHEARDDFYAETLPKMKPDLVIAVALARSTERWQGHIEDRNGNTEDLNKLELEATERTADMVSNAGAGLVISHSVMGTVGYDSEGWDPLKCLSVATTIAKCVVKRPPGPLVDSFYDTVATERDDVATIDVNKIICPGDNAVFCLPILDGQVVWRNPDHLTGAIGIALREEIWAQIEGTGLLD
jgi:Flp pilus assembly pilin Flp